MMDVDMLLWKYIYRGNKKEKKIIHNRISTSPTNILLRVSIFKLKKKIKNKNPQIKKVETIRSTLDS